MFEDIAKPSVASKILGSISCVKCVPPDVEFMINGMEIDNPTKIGIRTKNLFIFFFSKLVCLKGYCS